MSLKRWRLRVKKLLGFVKRTALFGAPFNWFDKADAHAQALDAMKAVTMRDTPSMMAVVGYAKDGWVLAQEALKDILLEYDNYEVEPPPYLRVYRMDLVDGRIPHLRGKNGKMNSSATS